MVEFKREQVAPFILAAWPPTTQVDGRYPAWTLPPLEWTPLGYTTDATHSVKVVDTNELTLQSLDEEDELAQYSMIVLRSKCGSRKTRVAMDLIARETGTLICPSPRIALAVAHCAAFVRASPDNRITLYSEIPSYPVLND